MHKVLREDVALALHVQQGEGPHVVFQHGLCGDAGQPSDVFPRDCAVRHVVLDCRGHGESEAGPLDALSIATFTDDLAAAIEGHGIAPCIIGGISMGAAMSLRLACMRPDLVNGLVLARPAWGCETAPANMRPNLEVGEILSRDERPDERDKFLASGTGRRLAKEAPDNLASLSGFFDRKPRDVTAALLTRISRDGPGVTEAQVASLDMPVLVIGHEADVVHPMALALHLAGLIPGARLAEIPPKVSDKAGYLAAFRRELGRFITETHHA
ncbi:MAG: alpha/beta hydrolase [Alphaproteobacteria bacterium]|nr:alpha/beta hydrolase [Alphaproteobacteria bacterium]